MRSIDNVMARAPLFGYVDSARRARLVEVLRAKSISPGQTLFRQGDNGDTTYLIVDGAFALQREELDGTRTALKGARAGELLGVASWLDPARRRSTARATQGGLVYSLDSRTVRKLRRTDPDLIGDLVRGLSVMMGSRLRDAQARLRKATGEEVGGDEPADAVAESGQAMPWPKPIPWERIPALRGFDREALAPLLAAAPAVHYRAGEWLCRKGEVSHTAFVVVGGDLVVVDERDENARVLSTLGTGSFVCQLALLTSIPAAASIRAEVETGVIALSRQAFRRLLDRHDPTARALLEQVTISCVRQLRLSSGVTSQLRARLRAQKAREAGVAPPGRGTHAPDRRPGAAPTKLQLWSHAAPRKPQAAAAQAQAPADATPSAADLVEGEAVLSKGFMHGALGRVGMSLEDLDQVEVAKLDGVISAAELKARKGG